MNSVCMFQRGAALLMTSSSSSSSASSLMMSGLRLLLPASNQRLMIVAIERRRLLSSKTLIDTAGRLRRGGNGDLTVNIKRSVGNNQTSKNMSEQIQQEQQKKLSIFKRFKEAYKQHGKVLIYCHILNCTGWIVGLFFLAKGGFDITTLFNVLERVHVMSHETSLSIQHKIDTFSLEDMFRALHFDYVVPEAAIKWLDASITGSTLKHSITAVMLYKILTPLRYGTTLAWTNIAIKVLKKRGVVPVKPPPGSSLPELIKEQQAAVSQNLKMQRERYARMKRQQSKKLSLFRGDMRSRMKSAYDKSTGSNKKF